MGDGIERLFNNYDDNEGYRKCLSVIYRLFSTGKNISDHCIPLFCNMVKLFL